MGRENWRRLIPSASLAATLVLGALLLAWPAPRRVSGSVPVPGADQLAMLESQSEFELANQMLGSDSLQLDTNQRSRIRLRYLCRLGRDADALAELERTPEAFDSGTAALLRAVLNLRLGNAATALEALDRTRPPGGLEAYAALVEAEAAAALGQWDRAHQAAERADDAPLPLEMRQRLLVVRGLAAQQRDDTATLRRMAPELGDAARRDDRTGLLLFDLARASARSGEARQARDWLLELLEARPTPAESAYVELQRGDTTPGNDPTPVAIGLAKYEIRSGRAAAARTRLQAALTTARPAIERAEMRLVIADTYLRSGEYSKCLDVLSRASTDAHGTRFEPERLRARARALRRSGQREAAMSCYRELARRFPSHSTADDALYEVGWLHETSHELRAAEQAYVRCERAFPRGSLSDDTDLRAGLCALRGGRPADAATHFNALVAQHSKSPLVDNALYWQMLSQVGLGDPSGALALRDRLEHDFPRSYFTVLARRRIERGLMSVPNQPAVETGRPAAGTWPADSDVERAQRSWTAYETALMTLRQAGLVVPDDFDSQARLWRFLQDAGFATEAGWEARRLEKRYEDQPGALLELLAGSHARGACGRLVRLAYLIGLRVDDPAYRDALEIILYPAPYGPTFAAEAARHGLSQAAVLGLARQESAFDSRIDSGAGARGLMQLMPEVGRRLWNDAGRSDWHADRLYVPAVNVELGCVLLAEELKRANGDLPQALAAYNAGGDVAEKWRSRLSPNDPPEMYVDLVEYAETRSYLKNVLGNIETYRRLYALP